MSLVGMRAEIQVDAVTPRRSGWLAASNVIDVPEGDHALMGAEYETDACILGAGGEFLDECLFPSGGFATAPTHSTTPTEDPTKPSFVKWFTEPSDWVSGDPFPIFAGLECSLVEFHDGAEGKTERKFDMIEPRQVDYHMARLLENHGNDLGECPLSQMIMNAEYASLLEYGGDGLIAMSAPLVVCAAMQGILVSQLDGSLATIVGTPVAAIAHNDAVSTANFFLTGRTTIIRGPRKTIYAPSVGDNQGRALAERVYVPLIECMAYYGTATCDAPVTP